MTDDFSAMRRCCSLLIVSAGAMLLTSCGRVSFYSAVASTTNCNMNPTIAREWPSPDGKRKLVQAQFDCPGWYALNLETRNPDGTKAIALMDRPVDQVRPARWPDLKVEWKSAKAVWITYPARQDTTCISKAGDVEVHCLDPVVAR